MPTMYMMHNESVSMQTKKAYVSVCTSGKIQNHGTRAPVFHTFVSDLL